MLLTRVRRFWKILGIDQAVAFTLAGHLWNIISGPLILALIVAKLSGAQRGVLFTLVSICEFKACIELGIGTVIQQLASRERASLLITPGGLLHGDPEAKVRLAAILRIGLAWFGVVFVVTNLALFPVGWSIFQSDPGLANIDWQLVWALSLVAAAAQGIVTGMFLFMAGSGDVTPVARTQALMNVAMSFGLCVFLATGCSLLSHPISGFVGIAVGLGWLWLARRTMLGDLWRTDTRASTLTWRNDIWPFQWRMAISWLTPVVLNHLMNPVTLTFFGSEVAGRVGLSLYIMIIIQVIGSSWLATRVPTFGILAAQKRWRELDREFLHVLLRTLGLVALLLGGLLAADVLLYNWHGSLVRDGVSAIIGPESLAQIDQSLRDSQPFVAPLPLAMLALAAMGLHTVNAMAAYLRAHCKEPMWMVMVPLGIAITLTLLLCGKFADVSTMIFGYTTCVLVIGLGGGTWVFLTKRREWHR